MQQLPVLGSTYWCSLLGIASASLLSGAMQMSAARSLDSGVGQYTENPAKRLVAWRALEAVRSQPGPHLFELLQPTLRVREVSHRPGHCPRKGIPAAQSAARHVPASTAPVGSHSSLGGGSSRGASWLGANPDLSSYTAVVSMHTVLGIRVLELYVSCGGRSVTSRLPAGWHRSH